MLIDEACPLKGINSATSPEGDKQQMGVFQPPMRGARSLFRMGSSSLPFKLLLHSPEQIFPEAFFRMLAPLEAGRFIIIDDKTALPARNACLIGKDLQGGAAFRTILPF